MDRVLSDYHVQALQLVSEKVSSFGVSVTRQFF
jgi:hypothetical protein